MFFQYLPAYLLKAIFSFSNDSKITIVPQTLISIFVLFFNFVEI